MFLRRKKKLRVELGELEDKRESLAIFLRSKLQADVTSGGNRIFVDSESLSSKELKRMVTKFIYQRNLMNTYWIALESGVVKIKKLKRSKKKEKQKRKEILPSTIKHGW